MNVIILVIILFFNMFTEIDKQIMLKFLEKNYPISRVKHKMKFRRAIIGNKTYILGDDFDQKRLIFYLIDIFKIVFSCDSTVSFAVITCFLNIK